ACILRPYFEDAVEDAAVQVFLGLEIIVERRLRQAGLARDFGSRRAVEAAPAKHMLAGLEYPGESPLARRRMKIATAGSGTRLRSGSTRPRRRWCSRRSFHAPRPSNSVPPTA